MQSTAKLACLTALGLTVFFGSATRGQVSGTDFSAKEESDLIYISAYAIADSGNTGDEGSGLTSVTEPIAFENPKFIVHAGGNIDEYTITNSLEAFQNALAANERTLETDFAITKDGKLVCIHDWNIANMPGFTDADYPLSYEDFKKTKLYGKYSVMTLEDVVSYMVAYPDLRIITDSKYCEDALLTRIAEDYPLLMDRFLIQVYDIEQFDKYSDYGFPNIILTVYAMPNEIKTDPEKLVELIGDRKLWGLTFPQELTEYPDYVETLLTLDIPLYVHTVNDLDRIAELFEMGITGIYTDLYLTESYGTEETPETE